MQLLVDFHSENGIKVYIEGWLVLLADVLKLLIHLPHVLICVIMYTGFEAFLLFLVAIVKMWGGFEDLLLSCLFINPICLNDLVNHLFVALG